MVNKPEIEPAQEAAYLRWLADDLQDNGAGDGTTWKAVAGAVLIVRAERIAPANRTRPKGNT